MRQKGLGLIIVHFDFTRTDVICCENSMAEFQTGESDVVKHAHTVGVYVLAGDRAVECGPQLPTPGFILCPPTTFCINLLAPKFYI
jgi:hypothetical protein